MTQRNEYAMTAGSRMAQHIHGTVVRPYRRITYVHIALFFDTSRVEVRGDSCEINLRNKKYRSTPSAPMPRCGALPMCVIAHMLQFCGPDTVLKVACTGAWRWNTGSPEAQRQVIAARRLCAIATSIRYSPGCSYPLWPFEFRGCRYIALVAVARNGYALQDAASELRADKEVVLGAVRRNGCALRYAASALTADKEVVLAAVRENGYALQFAASDLKADKEVVLAAVARHGRVLHCAAAALRADKQVVLAAVRENGYALQVGASCFRADKDVALAAVAQNGRVLEYAAPELRADKQVVLAAVRENGYALQFAASDLKADKEVVLAAQSCERVSRWCLPL